MEKKCLNCTYATNIEKDPSGYKSAITKREHLLGYCSRHKQILYDYQLHNISCSYFKQKIANLNGERLINMTNTEIKELIAILKQEGCNSKKQVIEYLEEKLMKGGS